MVTKIMQWVSIMALLLAVTWRPSLNYQIPLDFLVCAGAVLVILTLFIFHQTRNRDSLLRMASITDPTPARRVTVKL
jgi:hypothetical protein